MTVAVVRPTIVVVVAVVLWGSLNRTRSGSDKGKRGVTEGLQNKGCMAEEEEEEVQYEGGIGTAVITD